MCLLVNALTSHILYQEVWTSLTKYRDLLVHKNLNELRAPKLLNRICLQSFTAYYCMHGSFCSCLYSIMLSLKSKVPILSLLVGYASFAVTHNVPPNDHASPTPTLDHVLAPNAVNHGVRYNRECDPSVTDDAQPRNKAHFSTRRSPKPQYRCLIKAGYKTAIRG